MNVQEAVECVKILAPEAYSTAYTERYHDYDNTGFLLGEFDAPCEKIMLALDVTEAVAEEAVQRGASLIVSHHPFLYNPVHKVTSETSFGRSAIALIRGGVSVYSAHISLDCTLVNDALAAALGLRNAVPLIPVADSGIGRVGDLERETELPAFTAFVRETLMDRTVFAAGGERRKIRRVAVVGGAGGGDAAWMRRALECGADAYVSGDFKHHVLTEARESGIAVVSVSHYALEAYCLNEWAAKLKELTKRDVFVTNEPYPYL